MNFTMLLAPAAGLALTLAAHAQNVQSVTDLWATNCQNCHGDKGQGGGAGTRTLLTADLFSQKHDRPFFDAIKNGLPDKGMAAFGETMDDKKVWALVNHIRQLQGAALPHPATPDKKGLVTTQHLAFSVVPAATEALETPWSVDFIPSTDDTRPGWIMIVTNRPGFLTLYRNDALLAKVGKEQGMPPVWNNGQGGLLDITIDPQYSKPGNDWIYLAFSDPQDNNKKALTKVVRGKLSQSSGSWAWTNQQTLFEGKPEHYSSSGVHFGSKIVFDPTDPEILFFSIGERGSGPLAQDLARPNGKVHRIRRDGSIPKDNPFLNPDGSTSKPNGYPSVWSLGHRNPQGLAFDLHNRLFDTEHGPRGGDELNIVLKSHNYGWPTISFGINYNDSPLVTPWTDTTPDAKGKDFTMPIDRWMPSVGVCGLDTVRSALYPAWKGDLLAGGLSGSSVDRFRLSPPSANQPIPTVVEREEVLRNVGRVRDVVSAPDAFLYVVTNGPDRVIKLVPKPK